MDTKFAFVLACGLGLLACNSGHSLDSSAPLTAAGGAAAPIPNATSAAAGAQPATAAPAAPVPDTGDVPCPVADVLKARCVGCHGNTLRNGAPVTLVSAANFQKDAGGQTEGKAVLGRLRSTSRPMPPPPSMRLSELDIAPIEAWVNQGSPATHPGCSVDDSPAPAAMGGEAGVMVTRPTPTQGGSATPGMPAEMPAPATPPSLEQNWSNFGLDLANSRNNAGEKTLGVGNVANLKEIWSFAGPISTSTPAVVEGVVYLPGWDGKLYALRLEDGMSVWTTTLPDLIDSSPTVTATQVFVSDDNGSVHSLERTTGKLQWSTQVDTHAETHLWSSPVYIPEANILVVGVASGEEQVAAANYTFRGSVVALDATSGMLKWKFETASEASGSGPGIAVWGTAAVDTVRKALYIGTGNNYQPPVGALSDSMLAINYETGKLIWSRQFTVDDVFTIFGTPGGVDFDIGGSGNLFSIDGQDILGIGVKSGTYYALDRDTGAIKWMTSVSGGSSLGGIISGSAYANGMIFVASNRAQNGPTVMVALNAKDGALVWSIDADGASYAGVAHANGVVYLGTTSGSIIAVDGAKGTMLWVDQLPEPIAGGPVVSQGRLVVPFGYTFTLREGNPGRGGLRVYGL